MSPSYFPSSLPPTRTGLDGMLGHMAGQEQGLNEEGGGGRVKLVRGRVWEAGRIHASRLSRPPSRLPSRPSSYPPPATPRSLPSRANAHPQLPPATSGAPDACRRLPPISTAT